MAYRDEVLADSPTAYYRLGEAAGTTAADEVGAHAGTYVNTPTLGAAGAVAGNTAVTFAAGSSQRVLTTTLGTLGANLLTASAEFWVKTTTTALGAAFGVLNTGTTVAWQCFLNANATGALSVGSTQFYVRDNTGLQVQGTISTNLYDGAWHHVVMVVTSATTFAVYVDGVAVTVTYGLQNTLATFVNFGFAPTIAARNNRGTIDTFLSATLDEAAFYPTRLSAARVAAHFAAANPASSSARTLGLLGVGGG